MWFEDRTNRHLIDEGLLYPLRQTALRGNVQIQLFKLERLRQNHPEFFVVIHNGTDKGYYVPFSWLRRKILPSGKVRSRPSGPRQQYLTVDELRGQLHMFSFGLSRDGKPLRFNLAEFFNIASSYPELSHFMAMYGREQRSTFPEFSPKDSPFILSRQEAENRYNVDWRALRHGSRPVLLTALERRHFSYRVDRRNRLVITHPEAEANASDVAEAYTQLLQSGRISTAHVRTEAQYRPYQRALRDACLSIYGSRCAMCDLDIRCALTASHIRPASVDRTNRTNLRNVLLLCQLHDSLFDRNLITVKPDYAIASSPRLESSSRLIQEWVFGIEGQRISQPTRYPPDPDLLAWHARKSGVHI